MESVQKCSAKESNTLKSKNILNAEVLNHSSCGLGVFDASSGLMIWHNKAFKKMTWFGTAKNGRKATVVHYLDVFGDKDQDVIDQLFTIAMSTGTAIDPERYVRRGLNRSFLCQIKFIAFDPDQSGKNTHFVLELVDLSIEKLYEDLIAKEEQVRNLKNRLKTILDNAHSGFMLVDIEGKVQSGFSKGCNDIFDREINYGEFIQDLLQLEGRTRDHFEFALDQAFDDFLPDTVALKQIPDRFTALGKHLTIEKAVVRDHFNTPTYVLITIKDVTALWRSEEDSKLKQSLIHILQNRTTFERMLQDIHDSLSDDHLELLISDQDKLRALLHLMKGNFSLFGLDQMSAEIHQIEDKTTIEKEDFRKVRKDLVQFVADHREVLNIREDGKRQYIEVTDAKIEELYEVMLSSESPDLLRKRVRLWTEQLNMVNAREYFQPFSKLVQKLALKLNKQVSYSFVGGETKILPSDFESIFEVLPVVISNAVDHGIEAPSDRGEKSDTGRILIKVEDLDSATWLFSVSDDGRGLDAEMLRRKAVERGILTDQEAKEFSDSEAVNLIFDPEFSSQDEATQISGRGYGMVAVMEAVKSNGGHLDVRTQVGQGTTFTFYLPKKKRQTLVEDDTAA